jgi:hypothetical protein
MKGQPDTATRTGPRLKPSMDQQVTFPLGISFTKSCLLLAFRWITRVCGSCRSLSGMKKRRRACCPPAVLSKGASPSANPRQTTKMWANPYTLPLYTPCRLSALPGCVAIYHTGGHAACRPQRGGDKVGKIFFRYGTNGLRGGGEC